MISSAYDNTDLETCTLSLAYCTCGKKGRGTDTRKENVKNSKGVDKGGEISRGGVVGI